MSKESVGKFYDLMSKNMDLQKTFQEKFEILSASLGDYKLEDEKVEEIFMREIMPSIKKMGYEFTYSDIKAYNTDTSLRKLDDDELEAVAAGADGCSCIFIGMGSFDGLQLTCAISGNIQNTSKDISCFCFFGGGGPI